MVLKGDPLAAARVVGVENPSGRAIAFANQNPAAIAARHPIERAAEAEHASLASIGRTVGPAPCGSEKAVAALPEGNRAKRTVRGPRGESVTPELRWRHEHSGH